MNTRIFSLSKCCYEHPYQSRSLDAQVAFGVFLLYRQRDSRFSRHLFCYLLTVERPRAAGSVRGFCLMYGCALAVVMGTCLVNAFHVAVSCISLAATFYACGKKATVHSFPAAPPCRSGSRASCLLGCKRPRDGFAALPTRFGLRDFKSVHRNAENIFL